MSLRKSEVSVDRISVRNIIENLAEQGIHCLSYSNTNSAIDMLAQELRVHINTKQTSWRRPSSMVLSTTVCNSILTMVTNIWFHLIFDSREVRHTVYIMLLSN